MRTVATIAATCPPLLQQALAPEEADELAARPQGARRPRAPAARQPHPGPARGEACVCHLIEPLGLSQGTVSHHLKVLLDAGLVERDQRGSWAYYRVVPEALGSVRALLA